MRRPLKTSDAVEHERRGDRERGDQVQREHPVGEIHGARLAHPGAGLSDEFAIADSAPACQTGA